MQARSIALPILTCSLAFITHLGDAQVPRGITDRSGKPRQVLPEERLDALARAQVWTSPTLPVSKEPLGAHPEQPAFLECKFLMADQRSRTPRFGLTRVCSKRPEFP